MSDLVKRLAEKRIAHTPPDRMTPEDVARWWLNAIAGEFERHGWGFVARWLRAQAQEESP